MMAIAIALQGNTYKVETYGATADIKKDNAAAIQQAIDDCSTHGGGTVLLSKGTL